ncbi:unnamed protein product [Rhizophagus irregularis]|nr:unnamed protein product [Rhizophagus irregularis]CAB5211151.1 unnamed protein product [Rhizophagus irregularis]
MDEFLLYTTSTCFFLSKYLADRCLKQGFCGTLFEMVAYTIIRQGGDFQVHKLTDDGTQSECEIYGFDYLEEKFFDNVEEIQGQVKYY